LKLLILRHDKSNLAGSNLRPWGFRLQFEGDGEPITEGQGGDAGQPDEVDLPAFLTADLPDSAASMMAAE
jgi:hypothetical protein